MFNSHYLCKRNHIIKKGETGKRKDLVSVFYLDMAAVRALCTEEVILTVEQLRLKS